jgi:hypothetical protein
MKHDGRHQTHKRKRNAIKPYCSQIHFITTVLLLSKFTVKGKGKAVPLHAKQA